MSNPFPHCQRTLLAWKISLFSAFSLGSHLCHESFSFLSKMHFYNRESVGGEKRKLDANPRNCTSFKSRCLVCEREKTVSPASKYSLGWAPPSPSEQDHYVTSHVFPEREGEKREREGKVRKEREDEITGECIALSSLSLSHPCKQASRWWKEKHKTLWEAKKGSNVWWSSLALVVHLNHIFFF